MQLGTEFESYFIPGRDAIYLMQRGSVIQRCLEAGACLYIHIYLYMYVNVCMYIHICIYVCRYVCVYVRP